MNTFIIDEKHLSQIPAVKLLINMGFEFISPNDALYQRCGRLSNVLLEDILRQQLKKINSISFKSKNYPFTEENIQSAIQKIKNLQFDGLLKTNEAIYDMITVGTSLEQTLEGVSKSHTLNYIDWRNPKRNRFHVTIEYSVERSRSTETARPDIVLFVNGIPFAVIECKAPKVEIEKAISQSIRNQTDSYIPRLFTYSQLVMGINKNSAVYATTGSDKKFWSLWKEPELDKGGRDFSKLEELINIPLDASLVSQLSEIFNCKNTILEDSRLVTEQDKSLYALCRPERLLEIAWKFTVFDAGLKKIARYQQYFVVKSALNRMRSHNSDGSRKGGVIWHTQGSGKSLTMVMLARNLALSAEFSNHRIVLVTDRKSLDGQLGDTFKDCGIEPDRATSGRRLLELISEKKSGIITTLVHKFEKAYAVNNFRDESSNILILIDESHRTQFGSFSARMRQIFPNASYIGFTGTPLIKKNKSNFAKFGKLIEPHYSISQAVRDSAVVPLLYEGRHVELTQNQNAVDLWFERHTDGLSDDQKTDLKRKYARAEALNKADQVIYMRAFDISEHFRSTWQGTGFKAQLVAPDKASALKYHEYLNEIGFVSSEVIISPPDMREGFEKVDEEPDDKIVKFWQKMMERYGDEERYNKLITDKFKDAGNPEILIVVDKLLTGFDAPRNTVIYLCRKLREHTLLQAIARVNRLFDGKDFGFIVDYASVLGELDKALTMYSAFEQFDEADLTGALTSIKEEIQKLPELYSNLCDLFKTVKNSNDEEAYEVLLADDELREEFYARLSEFGKCLAVSMSSESFLMKTDEYLIKTFKNDFRKFQSLKASVKLRYAEAVDYRDYEPKIKKLLDIHIQANEVTQLNKPVNIFNENEFKKIIEDLGIKQKTTASKADIIAHATKRFITENMDKDPAFYKKFSDLIQKAIDNFRAERITDLEYLDMIIDYRDKITGKVHDNIPDKLISNDNAIAYYGILKSLFEKNKNESYDYETISADTALAIDDILNKNYKVHFWNDIDAQNKVINEIEDYLYDELSLNLSPTKMDIIFDKILLVAKHRSKP